MTSCELRERNRQATKDSKNGYESDSDGRLDGKAAYEKIGEVGVAVDQIHSHQSQGKLGVQL